MVKALPGNMQHGASLPKCKSDPSQEFRPYPRDKLEETRNVSTDFRDKEDYSKIRENDHISIIGLKDFQPGKPLTAVLLHADGTQESFPVNHTYNDLQIKWFKAVPL